ncbi:ankyrin repeat domain-containing protein 26-like isoform X4 [Syngnathoides biaculeatus]|uniref:ankyrin repeat domain-containing protein 26-like isoform X4 n=2 Tax=Syngnathoides biaculeatus TaxID=300417 RepID=UPI002ADE1CF9|nr:ankyrin repeat domain-containing protein 26-like isoform X4 [Syngnathoides biaculeatus]
MIILPQLSDAAGLLCKMKKLFASFSSKIRRPSDASDRGGKLTVGYKVKKRKMENFHKAAWLGDMTKLRCHAMCNDVNQVDKYNRTALHLACANGQVGVVSFLLAKKAKINLRDNQSRTALMKAVQCDNDLCVSILLENNADPDLTDADGNTALHLASKIPSISCVILLAKKDADLNAKNLKGLSPLIMAVRGNHMAVTELLLKKGADVNISDRHQRTPLIIAAGNGQMDMVQMLLWFKADITLRDDRGLSAEEHAVTNGHRPCALIITEHAAKGNPAPSLSPPVGCEETAKSEQGNPTGVLETSGGPSTSKDAIRSPIAECVTTKGGHDTKEELQPKETDMNKWGLLLSKCEEESLEKIELLDNLGFGKFVCNEDTSDTDKSINSSNGSLPGCKEEFKAEEFPKCLSPSLEEELVVVSPKVAFALPITISSDDKKVSESPTPPVHPHASNVILQESEESDWDQDSLISFCNETKTDKQQAREAGKEGSPEVSTASDGKSSFHSDKQKQKETVPPETCDEKHSEEEEEQSVLSNVVQSLKEILGLSKLGGVNEESQSVSTSAEQQSGNEDFGQSIVSSVHSVHEPPQWEFGSEDCVAEPADNSLKEEKMEDSQFPTSDNIALPIAELPSDEAPHSLTVKKESCVDSAPTVSTAAHDAPDVTEAEQSHQLNLEEPEGPPEILKTMEASCDADERASEALSNEQPEAILVNETGPSQNLRKPFTSQRLESQVAHHLSFNIRPDGQSEESSQLTAVSEACGLRILQSNGGISRDRFVFDSTLSDLSEDDERWRSAEWLKKTRNTVLNTDDSELSEDTDGLISDDSDVALQFDNLGTVAPASRSKKKLQDIINEIRLLKAKGHVGPVGERLRQLEIDNRVLEQTNVELQTDVTNLTVKMEMALKKIVTYENTNKKLEEDNRQAQMLLMQNHQKMNELKQNARSQLFKQKELEEEFKRSKSNEEQLRAELEDLRADTTIKQRDLSEENEALKDQVEDLRQDLKLSCDNENQNALDWNNTITSLKYELQLANASLETEHQAQDNLVAEIQAVHSRLADAERARSDVEKALLQEKEEHQLLKSEVSCHREAVNRLSQKLSKVKAHANTMESNVHRYEVQMVEKTMQLDTVQRENEQTAARVKELETALQAEKELVAQAATRQETTQELLTQARSECTLLRKRLEEAQSKAVANENALTDAKKSFNETLFKLRSDSEERVQQVQGAHKELSCKTTDLETLVRKLEQEKIERQTSQKQLQQELDDSLKKLSKSEASLEFSTRYRSDLEEEKNRLLQDIDNLKGKLQEKEAECIQTEKQMKERAALLDERENVLSFATRKQKEAQAAVAASNDLAKQLEEAVQRLELDNIRLEASAKQHSNKFDALQKVAQEDARVRVQLEDLVTDLQSRKITLEDQLNKEVQKHNALSNSAQDTQLMWEEELKSRSKLGLRLAEMEKEKNEMNTQVVEAEKKKTEEIAEQKRAADSRLEQEMKRNSALQKEMYRLQTLLKTAKRKLQDQQMSGADREKLSHRINELQEELEREVSSRSQLERTKRQLEDEVLILRRSQGPSFDGGCLGIQYRCLCSKALSPASEGPSCSVEEYLAKMRQDLDEAMSRELGNPTVKLDTSRGRVSPVSRARQQYADMLKKNHEV